MLHNCNGPRGRLGNRNEPRGRLGNRSGIPAGVDTAGNGRTSHGCARQGLAGKCLAGKCVVLSVGENAFGDVDQGPDRGGGLHGEAVVRRDGNSGDARERSFAFPGDHAICAILGPVCHVFPIFAPSDHHRDAELDDGLLANALVWRVAPGHDACVS
jgi:hypothetical protein